MSAVLKSAKVLFYCGSFPLHRSLLRSFACFLALIKKPTKVKRPSFSLALKKWEKYLCFDRKVSKVYHLLSVIFRGAIEANSAM